MPYEDPGYDYAAKGGNMEVDEFINIKPVDKGNGRGLGAGSATGQGSFHASGCGQGNGYGAGTRYGWGNGHGFGSGWGYDDCTGRGEGVLRELHHR